VLDEHGQACRYSAVKTRSDKARRLERVRPGEQHFDIVAVAEALYEAGTMVLFGRGRARIRDGQPARDCPGPRRRRLGDRVHGG
jgi:hypothetical protein